MITLHSIDTHDNVADAMTKSLGKIKFRKFLLGIIDPTQRHDNENKQRDSSARGGVGK